MVSVTSRGGHIQGAYNALGSHEVQPPLYNCLVKLHAKTSLAMQERVNRKNHLLGDAIHQKATHAIIAVIYTNGMTGLV